MVYHGRCSVTTLVEVAVEVVDIDRGMDNNMAAGLVEDMAVDLVGVVYLV